MLGIATLTWSSYSHCRISVTVVSMVTSVYKAGIPWKWFDLCIQILVATMAIVMLTPAIVDTFPLNPRLVSHPGCHGNHCSTPGWYI